jgi:pimeloyl-ACP methyl ester carboxylesterase
MQLAYIGIIILALVFLPLASALTSGPKTLYHGCIRSTAAQGPSPTDPTIVILHGLLGSSRNFQSWARLVYNKLDKKRDVVCMDLRNHGRTSSGYGSLSMDYDSMAADVLHTLKTLGCRNVHLIGHSMG